MRIQATGLVAVAAASLLASCATLRIDEPPPSPQGGSTPALSPAPSSTPPPAMPALVQHTTAPAGANGVSHQVTFPIATSSGDLVSVAVGWRDPTVSVASVSDTFGNSYLPAGSAMMGDVANPLSVFYASSIRGGPGHTVTVTFSQPVSEAGFALVEFSGVHTLSQVAVASGLSAAAGAMLASSGALVFSAVLCQGANPALAPEGGYSLIDQFAPFADLMGDEYQTPASLSSAGGFTLPGPDGWGVVAAAFR